MGSKRGDIKKKIVELKEKVLIAYIVRNEVNFHSIENIIYSYSYFLNIFHQCLE